MSVFTPLQEAQIDGVVTGDILLVFIATRTETHSIVGTGSARLLYVTEVLRQDSLGRTKNVSVVDIDEATFPGGADSYYLVGDQCIRPRHPDGELFEDPGELPERVSQILGDRASFCSLGRQYELELECVLHPAHEVRVNPNADLVRYAMNDHDCAYCNIGQGFIPSSLLNDALERGITTRPLEEATALPPLCPFCMGAALSDEHEVFVAAWLRQQRHDMDEVLELLDHIKILNALRQALRWNSMICVASDWLITQEQLDEGRRWLEMRDEPIEPEYEYCPTPTDPDFVDNLPMMVFTPFTAGMIESDRCMICLDDFTQGSTIVQLPCKHHFDNVCIKEWLWTGNTCPTCRYVMPEADAVSEEEDEGSSANGDVLESEEEDDGDDVRTRRGEVRPSLGRRRREERDVYGTRDLVDDGEVEDNHGMADAGFVDDEGYADDDEGAGSEVDYPASETSSDGDDL